VPRLSYGSEVKKRTKVLFTALLDYANDELENEAALERLRPEIQIHWQDSQRLVVRTKVRFLESLLKIALPDLMVSGEQIKEALRRLTDFLEIVQDNRPNRGGSEVWHFTLQLWHSRSDRAANLARFETEWENRRSPQTKSIETSPLTLEADKVDIWWQWCRETLEAQQYQRLTTNPLTLTDGIKFALEEVYVPQQLEKRDREIKSDRLEEIEASESACVVPIEEFLNNLLQPTTPDRIAILGEPGAGKTTLLQKIAAWLLERQQLPIWISLADLSGATLEEYLLQDWLKLATRKLSIPQELQEELNAQFQSGRVWLLLDAVDEMALDPSIALAGLKRQLRGWLAQARIVLTCRLNVWDSGHNPLENFTTYSNQSFSCDREEGKDSVAEFIGRWFRDNPELGINLRRELDKAVRQRVKDAVKNPLRLALLCRSWGLTPGNLPNTKATLYRQFVASIYQWKQDRFPTTPAQRRELDRVLGKLALSALDRLDIRFRLPHSFVEETLAASGIDLLPLALQLGWLNLAGISPVSGERLYTFYHSTFQEYFAAYAIADWRFFLPYLGVPHWREVILLWLGRDEIPSQDKEALMQALTNFEDGCGGFYSYRAYFLAAAGLAEFPQSTLAEAILQQTIDWRFGGADRQNWRRTFLSPVSERARSALWQSDRSLVIAALEKFVGSAANPFAVWNAAYSLGKSFDSGNRIAIATLTNLIAKIDNETLRLLMADSLAKIDTGSNYAIDTATEILKAVTTEQMRRKAAYILGKMAPDYPMAIASLEDLIHSTQNLNLQLQAVENLLSLQPENPVALKIRAAYRKPLEPSSRRRQQKSDRAQDAVKTIERLEERLQRTQNPGERRRIAYRLGTLQPGHREAIAVLVELLLSNQTSGLSKAIADSLQEILPDEQLPEIVSQLKHAGLAIANYLQDTSAIDKLSDRDRQCYKLLWYCSQRMSYTDFYRAWSDNSHR
jgi:hypothetical protein